MTLIAVTECPQGQMPGQIFEATEDAAKVLIMVGCAKPHRAPDETAQPTRRRTYRTRDLSAEG